MNETSDVYAYVDLVGKQARRAEPLIANAKTMQKNAALQRLAHLLRASSQQLVTENEKDLKQARANGVAPAFLDRLRLTPDIVETMANGCEQLVALPDPVGEISDLRMRPSGIQVGRMRVPLGVFGMIFESRPNVTIEAAALAIKGGNACILRGGSEAINSNIALAILVQTALADAGLPPKAVQLLTTTNRDAVGLLVSDPGAIDLIIPRGGPSLIKRVSEQARVPVLKHLMGNCHVYVDSAAEINMALQIVDNAKTQRYSPCNAAESLVVHTDIAETFLPRIGEVFSQKHVQLRADHEAKAILARIKDLNVTDATESDWSAEYLAPIMSVKLVDSLDSAIAHINMYGSHHTDAIVTTHHGSAMRFLREVDSGSVLVNASTRLADGFELGLGAEIGTSTDKFHARGPVGVEGLTCQKWVVLGDGQIRT